MDTRKKKSKGKSEKKGKTDSSTKVNNVPVSTRLFLTIDRNAEDVDDIFNNMTVPVSDYMHKKKECGIAYATLKGDYPSYDSVMWNAEGNAPASGNRKPEKVDELVICAHGAYFDQSKYDAAMEEDNAANTSSWKGDVAAHVRDVNELNFSPSSERHIGEYRLDQIADIIANIMTEYPDLHVVKFYVCETGQTYKFPGDFVTLEDTYDQDAHRTNRKITKFKQGKEVTSNSVNTKEKEMNQNVTQSICQIYAGKFQGRKLDPKERDEYLASYSNAEIILALVDEGLTKRERARNVRTGNMPVTKNKTDHFIIFKAPTGTMDVRKNDPKYRAFDRKDHDKVVSGNDDIADNRPAVGAVQYVLRSKK